MCIDLHRNGKTRFYASLIKMLNYYNIPLNLGTQISSTGSFTLSLEHLREKVARALFSLTSTSVV